MGDDDRSEQLPHRLRGAAQPRHASSASPALSDKLRQRMQAAVSAERARATPQDQQRQDRPGQDPPRQGQPGHDPPRQGQPGQDQERAEPVPPAIASAPADNGVAAPAASRAVRSEPISQPDPAVEPEPKVRPVHLVTPERGAGPRPAAGGPARRLLIATSAIAVALVFLAAGCLGVAVAKYMASWPAHVVPLSPAQQRAAAKSRGQAATWVTQYVSHAAVVSCDPQMCAALTADGFPSRYVRVLGPTAPYPLTSNVVVVTQAVRELFGSSLSSDYAPAVLATFGSADASITVRVIAPRGAAAYRAQLALDRTAAAEAGSDLAQTPGVTVLAEAKQQLMAGQVDARLLVAITFLAIKLPVDILDFGNVGPGGDPAIPLRYADLAESKQAGRAVSPAYLRALRASLGAVSADYRPTRIVTAILNGQRVLRIEFLAPTPLGMIAPQNPQ
jgi:hypothetical protein